MNFTPEDAQRAFDSLKDQASNISKNAAQLNDLVEQLQQVMQQAGGALGTCAEDLQTMGSMVLDYANGSYKEIPVDTIISAVIAILYVVIPIDAIPDIIPVIGHVDDAVMVAFVLTQIHKDVDRYRDWKNNQ